MIELELIPKQVGDDWEVSVPALDIYCRDKLLVYAIAEARRIRKETLLRLAYAEDVEDVEEAAERLLADDGHTDELPEGGDGWKTIPFAPFVEMNAEGKLRNNRWKKGKYGYCRLLRDLREYLWPSATRA